MQSFIRERGAYARRRTAQSSILIPGLFRKTQAVSVLGHSCRVVSLGRGAAGRLGGACAPAANSLPDSWRKLLHAHARARVVGVLVQHYGAVGRRCGDNPPRPNNCLV